MRKILLIALVCGALSAQAQTKPSVSILGDSYSTFEGYLTPDTLASWYVETKPDTKRTDVKNVKETWWWQVIKAMDWKLEVNNSWSGATICNTGYNDEDRTYKSFITRMTNLGRPDVILVFGGTNDAWANSPIGEFKYEGFRMADLFFFRPAMAYLLEKVQERYPTADLYVISNSDLKEVIPSSMQTICDHYGVKMIQLEGIDKKNGHPTVKGMRQIAGQVVERITADADLLRVYDEVKTPYKYGVVVEAPNHEDMVDCPSVFRSGDKWLMTYVLFNGRGYETWLAESDDLLHWQTKGKVMAFADSGWDKDQRGGFPALQDMTWGGSYQLGKFDGRYWMSYIGSSTPGYEGTPISIGLASTDGDISKPHLWQPGNQPVMAWDDADAGQWESYSPYKSIIYQVKNPTDSKFLMYYNAAQKVAQGDTREKIGIATSDDLRHWKRYEGNPIFQHDHKGTITGDAQIQRMGDLWVMFYYCAHNPEQPEFGAYNSFAVSRDLIHWTDWTGRPLVAPSEDYDARYAHKSFVVKWNGTVYHFYCAVDKNRHRTIALATSKKMK